METLDVRGLSCPIPVLKTKKLMDAGVTEILVLGSSAVSRENVQRLAHSQGYQATVKASSETGWEMELKKR
ncbi:MAG: sulfurtransferase TusA family protein [Syntrophomonadaceae bacterium]|nr:sulfurtransferase TusA family protein [Syntrophomonadaceae bacterium]